MIFTNKTWEYSQRWGLSCGCNEEIQQQSGSSKLPNSGIFSTNNCNSFASKGEEPQYHDGWMIMVVRTALMGVYVVLTGRSPWWRESMFKPTLPCSDERLGKSYSQNRKKPFGIDIVIRFSSFGILSFQSESSLSILFSLLDHHKSSEVFQWDKEELTFQSLLFGFYREISCTWGCSSSYL